MATQAARINRRARGQCVNCSQPAESGHTLCAAHLWSVTNRAKLHMARKKDAAIAAYGGYRCKCCGETARAFLTLDHVDGGGNEHRREIGQGGAIWYWLAKNHYPPGFQVLCFNCNAGRHLNGGICPHDTLRLMAEE